MRTSLIILAIILLVIGTILLFLPRASTEFTRESDGYTRTSYASFVVPFQIVYALLIIGVILFAVGLFLPRPAEAAPAHMVETKEHIKVGKGGRERNVVRERHERHVGHKERR